MVRISKNDNAGVEIAKFSLLKKIMLNIIIYALMIFIIFISAYPLFWVVISSFKTNAQILNNPFSMPVSLSFSLYYELLTLNNFTLFISNSFIVASVSTGISLIIYSMAGFVFAKFNFPLRKLLFALFVMTMMVPGMARVQPIFTLINRLNMYDTLQGLTFVYISFGIAMSLFILRTAFAAVPYTLDEAAVLDGAGFFKRFWHVNLPLAKNGLITAGTLMFFGNWNEFYYASLFSVTESTRTLPVTMAFLHEQFSYNFPRLFSALTIVILPGLVLYIVAQEHIRVSVVSSGIKG